MARRKHTDLDGWGDLSGAKFYAPGDKEAEAAERAAEAAKRKGSHRRKVACTELSTPYLYRRAFSELSLLDATPPLVPGHSYHFITAGDVDALSFLKLILRQQNLSHLYISTWCIHAEDVLTIDNLMGEGRIGALDFYVGEIFPNQYRAEYAMLCEMFERRACGRLVVFKNHSKLMGGIGDAFPFVAETSANINTNPRTEQACITLDKGLYDFYREHLEQVESWM